MTNDKLIARAMLATLNISAWSARKYDKKVTAETNAAHNAAADAGRYNKQLLPGDATSFKKLTSHIASTRVIHYRETLAWSDDGKRLLPIANFNNYTTIMRRARHEYDSLLSDFLADYPTLAADAPQRLNGMYRADDFPSVSEITGKFGFSVQYDPVPSGGDFRVELSQTEIDILATATENRVKNDFEAAHKDAVQRLYRCVASIHERLAQPDAIFRDSLITNATELCDILTRLNVTGDVSLEALRRQTSALATVSPDVLRNDAVTRIQTANDAQGILDAMMNVYGKAVTL